MTAESRLYARIVRDLAQLNKSNKYRVVLLSASVERYPKYVLQGDVDLVRGVACSNFRETTNIEADESVTVTLPMVEYQAAMGEGVTGDKVRAITEGLEMELRPRRNFFQKGKTLPQVNRKKHANEVLFAMNEYAVQRWDDIMEGRNLGHYDRTSQIQAEDDTKLAKNKRGLKEKVVVREESDKDDVSDVEREYGRETIDIHDRAETHQNGDESFEEADPDSLLLQAPTAAPAAVTKPRPPVRTAPAAAAATPLPTQRAAPAAAAATPLPTQRAAPAAAAATPLPTQRAAPAAAAATSRLPQRVGSAAAAATPHRPRIATSAAAPPPPGYFLAPRPRSVTAPDAAIASVHSEQRVPLKDEQQIVSSSVPPPPTVHTEKFEAMMKKIIKKPQLGSLTAVPHPSLPLPDASAASVLPRTVAPLMKLGQHVKEPPAKKPKESSEEVNERKATLLIKLIMVGGNFGEMTKNVYANLTTTAKALIHQSGHTGPTIPSLYHMGSRISHEQAVRATPSIMLCEREGHSVEIQLY